MGPISVDAARASTSRSNAVFATRNVDLAQVGILGSEDLDVGQRIGRIGSLLADEAVTHFPERGIQPRQESRVGGYGEVQIGGRARGCPGVSRDAPMMAKQPGASAAV